MVRVLAETAFARSGQVEEAVETVGLSGRTGDSVKACVSLPVYPLSTPPPLIKRRVALIAQIFLSINRPDLAKKEYKRTKKWAEDDLLLQLIESTINLVIGKEAYLDSNSFYMKRLANPSLSSTKLLTA